MSVNLCILEENRMIQKRIFASAKSFAKFFSTAIYAGAKIIVIFLNNALSAPPSGYRNITPGTSAALYNDRCLFFSRNRNAR